MEDRQPTSDQRLDAQHLAGVPWDRASVETGGFPAGTRDDSDAAYSLFPVEPAAAPVPGLRVGFVGLGSQGAPMADMIRRAGLALTVWARRPEEVESFADRGTYVAADLTELAERSDIVAICVVNDDDVDEVCRPLFRALNPGATIAVHSTVLPATVQRLARVAADGGITVLDAPVIGGGHGASPAKAHRRCGRRG